MVNPGWAHRFAAEVILKTVEARADLKVGNVPDALREVTPDGGETTEPTELLARVLAHIAHRLPGIRRVERSLEGKDLSSGPLSDLGALAVQLLTLNRERVEAVAEDKITGLVNKATEKATAGPSGSPRPPVGPAGSAVASHVPGTDGPAIVTDAGTVDFPGAGPRLDTPSVNGGGTPTTPTTSEVQE